ncbi:MAG: T9SS type A sorting domain-containing protein [bacterium]|nr:T9SS type A sorting domain-containing protein [bacterium]
MVVWEISYSTPWVVDANTHTVSWLLDANHEVNESIETNNDTSLTFTGIPPNDPPWIHLTSPVEGDTATNDFLITWDDRDNNNNAEIYLYWDNDTLEYNGNSIPNAYAIPEDDTTDAFLWDVSAMPEGPVWVLAFITDGFLSMWDYSDGPLYIHHPQVPNVPPTIQILHPTNGDTATTNSYVITWVDSDPDDNASINLYWDTNNSGFDGTPIPGAVNIPENNMLNSYTWGITSIPDGVYWVYASIADDDTTVWSYSSGPLVIDHGNGVITPYRPGSVPGQFTLESIYPNPFNSSTTVRLGLSHADFVQMSVYDNLGRLCAEPFRGRLEAGYFEVSWSPDHLPSGIYLVEIRTSDALQRSKAVFLK